MKVFKFNTLTLMLLLCSFHWGAYADLDGECDKITLSDKGIMVPNFSTEVFRYSEKDWRPAPNLNFPMTGLSLGEKREILKVSKVSSSRELRLSLFSTIRPGGIDNYTQILVYRAILFALKLTEPTSSEMNYWPTLAAKRFSYLRELFNVISSFTYWSSKDYSITPARSNDKYLVFTMGKLTDNVDSIVLDPETGRLYLVGEKDIRPMPSQFSEKFAEAELTIEMVKNHIRQLK